MSETSMTLIPEAERGMTRCHICGVVAECKYYDPELGGRVCNRDLGYVLLAEEFLATEPSICKPKEEVHAVRKRSGS